MIAKMTIQGRLSGENEIINANRTNRYGGANLKKKETARCAYAVMLHKVPVFTSPISLSISWFEPNGRRDPDNICAGIKFVADSLVATGKIPNDTRKYIKSIRHLFPEPDPANPRVEVIISDIFQ